MERVQLFAEALDSAPDAIVAVAPDGRIVLANRQVERVFGYAPAELVGRSVEVLVPTRFRRGHRRDRVGYFAAPRVRPMGGGSGELFGRRRDGSEFRCEISLSAIDTEDGLALAAIRDVTGRVRADEALRASERLRQDALEQMVRAQDEERAQIAADLHDDTIQAMTAALLRIDSALRKLSHGDGKRAVAAARATLMDAIERTRKLTFDLRPQLLEGDGLARAVAQAADEAEAAAGFQVSRDLDLGRYGDVVESIVFRTIQEALVNARKHAKAGHVIVFLNESGGTITGRVSDDGVGFDVDATASRARATHHLGTELCAERIRVAGGTYRVTSHPGSGTSVEFTLPAAVLPRASRPIPAAAGDGHASRSTGQH